MRVIHYLPGRLRVEISALRHDTALARCLQRELRQVTGIGAVQVNQVSARILIEYFPSQVNCHTVQKYIEQCLVSVKLEFKQQVEIAVASEQMLAIDESGSMPSTQPTEIVATLQTDTLDGLTASEARQRFEQYGANLLPSTAQPTIVHIFIRTLTESYMSKVLLGLGAFALIMGKQTNAMMSIGVLIANTTMAVVQEHRTQNSLDMLKELVHTKTSVVRDGQSMELEASKLVPGDIITLEAGDKVPADACLLTATQLVVEEASLTGESIPVTKDAAGKQKARSIYMGTGILSGRAKAVVVSTGQNTEIGRISRTMIMSPSRTPFYQRLDEVFVSLVNGALVISGVAVMAGLWHRQSVGNIIESATGLAVSFIPDGLAPIITLATALGAMRLLKQQVALRQMPAVDTLGCTTVICCDKTGTLTCNKMQVQEVYCPGMHWQVNAGKFVARETVNPSEISTEIPSEIPSESLRELFLIAATCNNARLTEDGVGGLSGTGDSTEVALLLGARWAGLGERRDNEVLTRLMEIPFSSDNMYMAVIVRDSQGRVWSLVKGAPDIILARCTSLKRGHNIIPMHSDYRAECLAEIRAMSGRALRVLALAFKPWQQGEGEATELCFGGLVGIIDPPRPEAAGFVASCHRAGVRVVMLTGDHRDTALALGSIIGITASEAQVVTGKELASMDPEELARVVQKARIYARTSPDQKQYIVRALKEQGEVVTMVGDGVNDVPAIKEAHLGVAMATGGTAVARESAAIALTDDNIGGLVEAIKEGRNVYANIRRTLRYMITTNFGDGIVILLAAIMGRPIPLTPLQLLWLNATSDPYVSWSLANFPPSSTAMAEPPRKADVGIFALGLGRKILSRSVCLGISAFMTYSHSI
ncbi:MAG: HAD-IC family P-type ATPase, partial [Peptococcaceae bacterium]|nr:HAD-IC family P-type ATPase [Peptococcaceae bacterium]